MENKVSVIIATINRKDDLKATVQSILNQTIKFSEIIIIDQSNTDDSKKEIEGVMKESPEIDLIYVLDPTILGLTHARNLGVKLSRGNILIFLDDDVVLEDNYIEATVNVFKAHPSIYGVGGFIKGHEKTSIIKKVGYYLFHHGPFRDKRIEFYRTPKKDTVETNRLSGGTAAYRKEIFCQFSFDENYRGYSRREDEVFSYRVSKRYRLVLTQRARLTHKQSPIARDSVVRLSSAKIFSLYYFFYKNIEKKPLNLFLYCWLNIGYVIDAFLSFDFRSIKGTLIGFKKIIKAIAKKEVFKELQTL